MHAELAVGKYLFNRINFPLKALISNCVFFLYSQFNFYSSWKGYFMVSIFLCFIDNILQEIHTYIPSRVWKKSSWRHIFHIRNRAVGTPSLSPEEASKDLVRKHSRTCVGRDDCTCYRRTSEAILALFWEAVQAVREFSYSWIRKEALVLLQYSPRQQRAWRR